MSGGTRYAMWRSQGARRERELGEGAGRARQAVSGYSAGTDGSNAVERSFYGAIIYFQTQALQII